MALLTLTELKKRFQTKDKPSQADFISLIDTLAQIAGSIPTGPAGNGLAGTYPDPSIAANAIGNDQVQDNSIKVIKLDPDGNPNGAVPTLVLGAVNWVVPGTAGSSPSTPDVSGAVRTYTSDLEDMPGANAVVQFAIPDFTADLPGQVRVVARFKAAHANYAIGDEVEITSFVILSNPEIRCFHPVVYYSGGMKVDVRVTYGANIAAANGMAVWDKSNVGSTVPPASNTLVAFTNVADVQSKIQLRVYATQFENGTGFGSIVSYQPSTDTIPVAGSAVTKAHGFGANPSWTPKVALVCAAADVNYVEGDEVPIAQAFVVDGDPDVINPAFSVQYDTTNIVVRRAASAASILIPDKSDGDLIAITPGSWEIRVEAHRAVNIQTHGYPNNEYMAARASGGITFGDNLYMFHYNRHDSKTFFSVTDMNNDNVALGFSKSGVVFPNMNIFRLPQSGSPVNRIVWSTDDQIGAVDPAVAASEIIWSVAASEADRNYKPQDFDDSGPSGLAHPDLLMVGSDYDHSIGSLPAYKLVWNGSSYTKTSYTNFDWRGAAFTGNTTFQAYHSGNASFLLFQYNHVKKRIYVMTTGCGFMFIYKMNPAGVAANLFEWWDGAQTVTDIILEKVIAVRGLNNDYENENADRPVVSFDPASGEEKNIILTVYGSSNFTGGYKVIPWTE